eukprot:6190833-Pleurochrysis_carterae.AAC.1
MRSQREQPEQSRIEPNKYNQTETTLLQPYVSASDFLADRGKSRTANATPFVCEASRLDDLLGLAASQIAGKSKAHISFSCTTVLHMPPVAVSTTSFRILSSMCVAQ